MPDPQRTYNDRLIEGAWALPAPPAGDPPRLTLEALPDKYQTETLPDA